MADSFLKGRHSVKSHKPSRLRNEIQADSTDEEIVQVPGSEAVVPQTQLQLSGVTPATHSEADKQSDYGGDDGFDDADLIARTVVNAKEISASSTPVEWTPLSRDSFQREPNFPITSPPPFTFGQPSKVLSKPISHDTVFGTQQDLSNESHDTDLEPLGNSTKECYAASFGTPRGVQSEPGDLRPHEYDPCPRFQHDRPDSSNSGTNLMVSAGIKSQDGSKATEEKCAMDPPAQPPSIISHGPERMRTVKKGKRARKGTSAPRHEGPWPPRIHTNSSGSDQAITQYMPNVSVNFEGIVQDEHQDSSIQVLTTHRKTDTEPSAKDSQGGFSTEKAKEIRHIHEVNQQSTQNPYHGALALSWASDSDSIPISVPAAPIFEPNTSQKSLIMRPMKHSTKTTDELNPVTQASSTFSQHDVATLPTNESHMRHEHSIYDAQIPPTLKSLGRQDPVQDTNAKQKTATQQATQRPASEALLHEPSTLGGPRRVIKPRKKSQTSIAGSVQKAQGPPGPSPVDRHFESLRVALLAEQFRQEHEHTASIKHYEDLVSSMKGHISLQDEMIAEWKRKHQDLGNNVTRLTEKAKTNQTYVTGLHNDYEKLQKTVNDFKEKNKITLREMIAEVETERDCLRKDFEFALDSWNTSQKKMNFTIQDLALQLSSSQAARKRHAECLREQEKALNEERQKRDELQKALMATAKSIKDELNQHSTAFIGKISILQSSVDAAAAAEFHDPKIEECLIAIRKLQSTPVLTLQDVQKAEGMLRFVHELLASGFESMSKSEKQEHLIYQRSHDIIKAQLQSFQTEIVKYHEAVEISRKVSETDAIIKTELKAEKAKCSRLENEMTILHEAEKAIKERSIQLECDFRHLQESIQLKDANAMSLEKQLCVLRQQLEQANRDLSLANDKTEKVEQLRKEMEIASAHHQTKYLSLVKGLQKLEAERKQKQKTENFTEMREKIASDIHKEFREKECGYKNDIHRLALERDEKEKLREKLHDELSSSKDQLHELRKDYNSVRTQLDALQNEYKEAKVTLKDLRHKISISSANSSSVADMTEKLREKTKELQSREQEHTSLQQQYKDMSYGRSELKSAYDQLREEFSHQSSELEAFRRESEDRSIQLEKRSKSAIEKMRTEVSRLQQEKEEVEAQLEQAHSKTQRLENCEVQLSLDRDELQQRLNESHHLNAAKEKEILQLKEKVANEHQKLAKTYRAEMDSWAQRQAQTDAMLKEAETNLRRQEDENQAKIKYEREKAEIELTKVVKQYELHLQSRTQHTSNTQQAPTQAGNSGGLSYPMLSLQKGANRKKVSRQNNSVFNITSPSATRQDQGLIAMRVEDTDLHRQNSGSSEILFEPQLGDLTSSKHVKILRAGSGFYGIAAGSQDLGPTLTAKSINNTSSQASKRDLEAEMLSSTDLSTMNSEVLENLEQQVANRSGSSYATHSVHNDAIKTRDTVAINQCDSVSESDSRSSQSHERPKSQANTASRLIPPSTTISKHFVESQHPDSVRETTPLKLDRKGDESLPKYMPPPIRPTKRQTYGHRKPTHNRREQDSPDPLQGPNLGSHKKRKEFAIQEDTVSKRQRTLSQYQSGGSSSKSRNQPSSSISASKPCIKTAIDPSQYSRNSSARSRTRVGNSSSSVAPRTPTQSEPAFVVHGSFGQHSSLSTRSSRHATRSKNRNYKDAYGQRFSQELDK